MCILAAVGSGRRKIEMAGVSYSLGIASTSCSYSKFTNVVRSCSNPPPNPNNYSEKPTPPFLKFAVSGVTEILRIFDKRVDVVVSKPKDEELSVSGVDDVVGLLIADYGNAYFVTGVFTSSIYADECLFEDPTIRFQGTELYARNLKLLVPFFEQPSIVLKNIEKGTDSGKDFVLANWSLRTWLRLPWRPLIAIEGSTVYSLNDEYKIIRHSESWSVSALDAVGQIFTPGVEKPSG